MTNQEIQKIVATVETVLGQSGSLEIDMNDSRIKECAPFLRKARVRHPLSSAGIVVDFPQTGDVITISRIGAAIGKTPTATAKKADPAPKAPVAKPAPKRHQHTYHKSPFVDRIIDIFNDAASHIIYLVGPTQCGKSTDVREVSRMLGRKLFTFSCNAETMYDDLFGANDLSTDDDGNTVTAWKAGIIEQACREGMDEDGNETGEPAILFIDEAPSMNADIAIALNRFLESDNPRRELVINRDGGRTIWSHSGLRIVMAGNTALRGAMTDSESFHTAQMASLDLSFVKRLFCCFRYGYNRSVEKSLLLEKVGDDKVVADILKFRDKIRDQIRAKELATPFTTKDIIKIADAYRIYKDLSEAIYYSLFGFLLAEEVVKYNEAAMLLTGKDILKEFQDPNLDYMD